MSERTRIINGKTIFSIVIVVLLVLVTSILIALNLRPKYNDDYFKTDGTKIVASITDNIDTAEEMGASLEKAYMVYYYSGNTITEVRIFYKYENDEVAKAVFDKINVDDFEWTNKKSISDSYVILNLAASEFNELTTEMVREFSD
jgi:hypothetical protein